MAEKKYYVNEVKTGAQLQELRMQLMRKRGTRLMGQQKDYMSRPEFEKFLRRAGAKKVIEPSPNNQKILDIENENKPVPASWLDLLPQTVTLWFHKQEGRPKNVFLSKEDEQKREDDPSLDQFSKEPPKKPPAKKAPEKKDPPKAKETPKAKEKEPPVEKPKETVIEPPKEKVVETPGEKKDPPEQTAEEKEKLRREAEQEKIEKKRRILLAVNYHADGLGHISPADIRIALRLRLNGLTDKIIDEVVEDLLGRLKIKKDALKGLIDELPGE